jgi:hypothetical protein
VTKVKWGLQAAAEEMDDQGFYDGPVPPKGRYICAIRRLQVKETANGDPRFNGLLEIRDPRKGKSQYNGYAFWLGINITEKSVRFVTNFIKQGLGVPFKDLADLDKLLDVDSKDLPANVLAIGRVKFGVDGKEPLIVVNAKRRRQNDDPDGDWELTTDDFAPAFPGIDPKKLAAEDGATDDEDDEDDADDMFEDGDDEDDADTEDDEDEDEDDEDEDEDALTREELEDMGLTELRELAVEQGVMTKVRASKAKKSALVDALAPDEDEDEDDEDEEEEEQAPPPRRAARKAPAKSTRSTRRR